MSDARLYRDFLFDDVKTSGMLTVPTKRILASTPNPIPSPFEPVLPQGSIAYNVVDDTMYFSNGTTWETMGGAVDVVYPLEGDGTAGDPIKITDGSSSGNYLVFNATAVKWDVAPSGDAFGPTNVFLGAGLPIPTGENNISLGVSSGAALTTGARNAFIGNFAGAAGITEGSDNIFIGHRAGITAANLISGNVVIGSSAGKTIEDGNNVIIGFEAGKAASTVSSSVIVGAGAGLVSESNFNVIIGPSAGAEMTTSGNSVVIGANAGFGLTKGSDNVLIGPNSGLSLATATSNIAMGTNALSALTSNGSCISIGVNSLQLYNGVDPIVAIGVGAFQNIASTGQNVAVGHGAAQDVADCIRSTFVGYNAGISGTATLSDVTAIGSFTLQNIKTGGDQNTAVGANSGNGITSGSNNTLIGANSATTITTGESNVIVGRIADGTSSSVKQSVIIGAQANGSSNNVVIGFNANDDGQTNCIVLGQGAKATAANQIALASGLAAVDTPAGGGTAVPANFSGSVLNVIIGATPYQILLYTP